MWQNSLGLPIGQPLEAANLLGRLGWGELSCRPHSSAMKCPSILHTLVARPSDS